MRKLFLLLLSVVGFAAYAESKSVIVEVKNTLPFDRKGEMIEVPMAKITKGLGISGAGQIVVKDNKGQEVAYQITSDDLLIFQAEVPATAKVKYTVAVGTPKKVAVSATGNKHPERLDDMAWENDLVGFRAYGPALQKTGERGYGYDLFLKRGSNAPFLDNLYKKALDPETAKKIKELRKTDPKAAGELSRAISYHLDHGLGMDCYGVGPTLGAGVAALMAGDSIVYPWCYKDEEILDNGPLRFSVKLTFNPERVGDDASVVETRIITLDKGQHLNRTKVSFEGLTKAAPMVAGIVLHEGQGVAQYRAETEAGYLSYVDPTQGNDNGKVFVGLTFPKSVKETKAVFFSPKEKAARSNADGHVLAYTTYKPGTAFTYYWGFAWDRGLDELKNAEAWNAYLTKQEEQFRNPLIIKVK